MDHVVIVDQVSDFFVAACRIGFKIPGCLGMVSADHAPRSEPSATSNEDAGVDELLDYVFLLCYEETFVVFESRHVGYWKNEIAIY